MAAPLISLAEMEKISPVFRGRAGNAFARWLLKVFDVTAVQKLYDGAVRDNAPDTAAALVAGLDLKYTVAHEQYLEQLPAGPFITISNHPIGSMDGVILADYMGHKFPDYKLLVNQFLMRIEALRPSFIPVVPTGEERTGPKSESVSGIRIAREHLLAGHPLGLFPSGAVSDLLLGKQPVVRLPECTDYVPDALVSQQKPLSYTEPKVRDREWQMPIVKFIKKAGVPVLPIRFFDGNTDFFYRLGAVHGWKIRTLRLPHEVMTKRGKTIRMGLGPVITVEQQASCKTLAELRTLLRASVYSQEI